MPPRGIEQSPYGWIVGGRCFDNVAEAILYRDRLERQNMERQLLEEIDTDGDRTYWGQPIREEAHNQGWRGLGQSMDLDPRPQGASRSWSEEFASQARAAELRRREQEDAREALRRIEADQERERRQLEAERDRLQRELARRRQMRQPQPEPPSIHHLREQELDMMERKLQEYQQAVEDWGHVYDQWGAEWHKEKQSQRKEQVKREIEEMKRTLAKFGRNVDRPVPASSKRMPGPPPDPIVRKQSADRKIFILDEE